MARTSFSIRSLPRPLQGAALGFVCAAALWILGGWIFFKSIERGAFEQLFLTRGVRYPAKEIVIVEVNDAATDRYEYPLPRRYYAQLIDKLSADGARVIAFDILFPIASASKDDDKKLVESTRRSGRVIHAAVFNFESRNDTSVSPSLKGNATDILPRFAIPQGKWQSSKQVGIDPVRGTAAMAPLQQYAAGLGHVNAPPEANGLLYRIPHLLLFHGGRDKPVLYPSLALATAARYLDIKPSEIRAEQRSEIALSSARGTHRVPLDGFDRSWVNWIGPHDSFASYPITQVLDGEVPPENFKDKIIFIGTTAAGSFDYHPTPFSPVQPAVELQANALDDILMRRSLVPAPNALYMLLLFAFPTAIGAFTVSHSARVSGIVTFVACVALWLLALGLFSYANFVLPVASALVAGLMTWGAGAGYRQYLDAHQLRRAEERYALAVRGANDGLWDWDIEAGEIYFSPRWKSMLGLAETEIGNKPDDWYRRIHPEDVAGVRAHIDAHLAGGVSHFESQHRMKHRDGRWVWVLSRGLRVDGPDGKPARMAGSQSDISQQIEANEQLEHNAFYDSLTGLPNRALFMDVLARALARSQRRADYRFAVLFMDLDRFKLVNDSLGHARGDEFLVAVARRLEISLRPGDTAARLGGDEFTVLLDDIGDAGAATRVVERIQSELTRPFEIGGHEVFPTSSIGIALNTPNYNNPEELLRDADTAMYRAKALGRARHAVFDEAMHEHALALLRLETDLRRALERQNFQVYYQPIVALATGEVSGFEALVRWNHPERGMVPPGEFIALAEETGLIIPLDQIVLREACTQLLAWQNMFEEKHLTISVNLSSKQFTQPELVAGIARILEDTGLDPSALKLEITEGVLMNNPETAAAMLRELREMGIRLSIDDFGTGYSSLSYLHRFPLDTLKIDQSFVNRMGENGENTEIVNTIVSLARNLGMEVIAEGIETATQMRQLHDLQCEYGQGYYFARPLPAGDAQALLAKGTAWLATA